MVCIGYNNTVLAKLIAEIWECSNFAKKKSKGFKTTSKVETLISEGPGNTLKSVGSAGKLL